MIDTKIEAAATQQSTGHLAEIIGGLAAQRFVGYPAKDSKELAELYMSMAAEEFRDNPAYWVWTKIAAVQWQILGCPVSDEGLGALLERMDVLLDRVHSDGLQSVLRGGEYGQVETTLPEDCCAWADDEAYCWGYRESYYECNSILKPYRLYHGWGAYVIGYRADAFETAAEIYRGAGREEDDINLYAWNQLRSLGVSGLIDDVKQIGNDSEARSVVESPRDKKAVTQ